MPPSLSPKNPKERETPCQTYYKEWSTSQSKNLRGERSGERNRAMRGSSLATTLGYWWASDQPDGVHLCFRWDRVSPHLTMKTKPRHFNQGETQAYNSQALYLKIIQYRAFSVQERITWYKLSVS